MVKKRKLVPLFLQTNRMESGAACLTMVAAYYHKRISLERLRNICRITRDGISANGIEKGAAELGMTCSKYTITAESLVQQARPPVIISAKENRWIVYCGQFKGRLLVNDPERGRRALAFSEFADLYDGVCLEIAPGQDFRTVKQKTGFLRKAVQGNERILALSMLTLVLASAAGILFPVLSKLFTDDILAGNRESWVTPFFLFYAGTIIYQLVASILNIVYLYRVNAKIAADSNVSFMWHLLHLPMKFFEQRNAGEIAGRQAANDIIAGTLVRSLSPILMNMLLLVFYLSVMFMYSVPLALLGIMADLVNLFLAYKISEKRKEASRMIVRDQGKLEAATAAGIDMIETIKATGAEDGYFERWSGIQASAVREKVRFAKVNAFLGTLPDLIMQLFSILILITGLYLIIEHNYTAGTLLAFQGLMTAFMNPVKHLILSGQNLSEMEIYVERVDDIMQYPEEEDCNNSLTAQEYARWSKLSGKIELKNVTFGYSDDAPPLIENFSLSMEPGTRVAFVGGSGSGKSTLAKLMTGLYKPWSGEILFDGMPIGEIPSPVFRSSVSMVEQECVLFHDTIANNITMWDDTIEDHDISLAAMDADIYQSIVSRKGSWNRVIEENGRDLSGGERQRLEIARALAMDPSILIMDEATSALDAETEFTVSQRIHDRNITCILIAHRLSTIRDCDEIIVLDHGKVAQRGKHDELMAQDGIYRRLIMTD